MATKLRLLRVAGARSRASLWTRSLSGATMPESGAAGMVKHYDPSPRGPDDPALRGTDRSRPMEGCLIMFVAFVLLLFGFALIFSQWRQ